MLQMWLLHLLVHVFNAHQMMGCSCVAAKQQLTIKYDYRIPDASGTRSLRVLYRFYAPTSEEYIFVSCKNRIFQFDTRSARIISERHTGPKNFSIFCISEDKDCGECADIDKGSLPPGYSTDFCGPRLTDNFVKAWATSTVPESEVKKYFDPHAFYVPDTPFTRINDDRIACEDALYVCYNVHHGFCERLRLTNINETSVWLPGFYFADKVDMNPGKIPVTGSDPTTFSVLSVGAHYIYVATESDGLQKYTLINHPPLSVRLRNFHFADSPPGPESFLRLTVDSSFRIQYKHSFRYRSRISSTPDNHMPPPAYIYFIFQQPESLRVRRWQPRIARICDGDRHFNSYVELNLVCEECMRPDYVDKTFTALHKSSRGTVGRLIAAKLASKVPRLSSFAVEDSSEVVVVAFSAQHVDPLRYRASVDGISGSHYMRDYMDGSGPLEYLSIALNGSAVSLFSMAQIDFKFDSVIAKCLNGRGITGPVHFLSQQESRNDYCVPDHHSKDGRYYCPSRLTLNRLITGQSPEDTVGATAFLHLPHNVTDVAITSVADQFTVVILTTDDGWLYKYELSDLNESRQLDALLLTTSNNPLTSLSLDVTGAVAFVTSLDRLLRVELSNCSAYKTCVTCIQAGDPYCGWCVIEGRCMLFGDCQSSGFRRAGQTQSQTKWKQCDLDSTEPVGSPDSIFSWLAYTTSSNNCPIIKKISPTGIHQTQSFHRISNQKSEYQAPIVLKVEGSLANDLRVLTKNSFAANPLGLQSEHSKEWLSDDSNSHLVCCFRNVEDDFVFPEHVFSGSLIDSDIDRLLLDVTPGPLLTHATARVTATEPDSIDVRCNPPLEAELPELSPKQASSPVILWLEWLDVVDQPVTTLSILAPALFAVYNCTRLTNCKSCAQSRFGCDWCIVDDRCLPVDPMLDVEEQFKDSECFSSPNRKQPSSGHHPFFNVVRSGQSSSCPSFRSDGKPITLMSGSPLIAEFRVFNIRQPISHFSCMDGCSQQRVISTYNAAESVVICRITRIDLSDKLELFRHQAYENASTDMSSLAALNCSLDLFWHGQDSRTEEGHKMVNLDNVKVEVYTCDWLADYCDSCLDLPIRFGCGWCASASSNTPSVCSTRNQCAGPSQLSHFSDSPIVKLWLQPGSLCPNPLITSLVPLNGTITGQTVLHVEGRNLGRRIDDIIGRVGLAGSHPLPCDVIPDSYRKSRAFDCRLAVASNVGLPHSAPLKLKIGEPGYQCTEKRPIMRWNPTTVDGEQSEHRLTTIRSATFHRNRSR